MSWTPSVHKGITISVQAWKKGQVNRVYSEENIQQLLLQYLKRQAQTAFDQ